MMGCMATLYGLGQTQTSLDAAYALRSAARPTEAIAMARSFLRPESSMRNHPGRSFEEPTHTDLCPR